MKMPMAVPGGIPTPAMQLLETKFKDIVEAHVQDLLTTLEASLESHHSDLSSRIEKMEIQMGQASLRDSCRETKDIAPLQAGKVTSEPMQEMGVAVVNALRQQVAV